MKGQGPDDDEDILPIDVAYGAAAAHCEAWRRFPHRLLPAAQTGLQMSRQDSAREFTKLSMERCPQEPTRMILSNPTGFEFSNIL